jgi:predicted GTPase
VHPLGQWRSWILVLLLAGPVFVYIGLGTLWLWERGWIVATVATAAWVLSGVVFSILAARWTKTAHPIMPPLDWNSPQTFSPRDRDAWQLVQKEADHGESLSFDVLLGADVYIETGRRLFRQIAAHYHPQAANPLDDVPLLELLTALELAADDLAGLCRQIPGGDMITLAHWRKALQVAGYITKANDLYSYLLPFLNPVGGLARWGARQWIVKPAWKSMQQNVLRWFYQAYLNRLGTHLIELMSGRLAIGAHQYRRLTRQVRGSAVPKHAEIDPLVIVIAGAQGSGKSRLLSLIHRACSEDVARVKVQLATLGLDSGSVERMNDARWIEAPGYNRRGGAGETRRERSLRQAAVDAAVGCDLLVLVIDGRGHDHTADAAFASAWDRWFLEHPEREVPPALVVLTGVDRPDFGAQWTPPYDWAHGSGAKETAVRARFDALRTILPPTFHEFVAVGLPEETPFGVIEHVLPALVAQWLRAERSGLLRRLHQLAGRSKVGRLLHQLGEHGRSLWRSRHNRQQAGAESS